MPSSKITLVLADDHQVFRSGLRVLLTSTGRFEILGESGDVASTLDAALTHRPQVLVLDLNMGGESALELIPRLRNDVPDTHVVVLTMQENPGFARAALQSGASGYVLKEAAESELMTAIQLAAEGRQYLNPELGARLASVPAAPEGRPDSLSGREVEVLRLIALGHTNPEIAASLRLSIRTVESHRSHIQQKIRLTSRAQLVAYARDHGLLE